MCCFLIVAAVLLGLGPGLHSQNEGRNWAIVLRLLLLKAGVADSHGLCVPWLEYLVFLSAQLRFIPNWLICHVIGGEPVVTWRYFYWEEAGVCAQVVGWIPELALCCRSFLQILLTLGAGWISAPNASLLHGSVIPQRGSQDIQWKGPEQSPEQYFISFYLCKLLPVPSVESLMVWAVSNGSRS